jgi:hypothetical protein
MPDGGVDRGQEAARQTGSDAASDARDAPIEYPSILIP